MSPLDLLTQEYLDALNELVSTSSPSGAYAMGLATALALRGGFEPDRELLEAARSAAPLPTELWTAAADRQVQYAYDQWAAQRFADLVYGTPPKERQRS